MASLVSHIFTADPAAHVFDNRVYVYVSHDRQSDAAAAAPPVDDNGDQYDMVDYHVLSADSLKPLSAIFDHGVTMRLADVPWASRQLWAPDMAGKDEKYFLYFPARDRDGLFRIGVAVGPRPEGPFTPDPDPIEGSYSIDPTCFTDDDGESYLFFGGLRNGQLQYYRDGSGMPDPSLRNEGTAERSGRGVPAQGPCVARLSANMRQFASPVTEIAVLTPDTREPILADDHDRRFFSAAWVHKHAGTYYLSYSTGDTRFIVYATSETLLGPYTYRGRLLEPVLGQTTHHSVVEFCGLWWLFYHDADLSEGVDHLRSVKVIEISHDEDGMLVRGEPPIA